MMACLMQFASCLSHEPTLFNLGEKDQGYTDKRDSFPLHIRHYMPPAVTYNSVQKSRQYDNTDI
jgi:hypothetical protein